MKNEVVDLPNVDDVKTEQLYMVGNNKLFYLVF